MAKRRLCERCGCRFVGIDGAALLSVRCGGVLVEQLTGTENMVVGALAGVSCCAGASLGGKWQVASGPCLLWCIARRWHVSCLHVPVGRDKGKVSGAATVPQVQWSHGRVHNALEKLPHKLQHIGW